MKPVSYVRHQFPPSVIQQAVRLYLRFTLGYRDVEELPAERGLEVSDEPVRRSVLEFGSAIAEWLRRQRPRPSARWHLDEMVIAIGGQRLYLWRAVDDEGEVLDALVQRRRNRAAALKLMRRLLKKQGFAPTRVTTDRLRSYGAAFAVLGLSAQHEQGLRLNNRAEVSHQPVRRRERQAATLQVTAISPRFPRRSRSCLQQFQSSTPLGLPSNTPLLPSGGHPCVGDCGRSGVTLATLHASLVLEPVPVTMPPKGYEFQQIIQPS